MGDGLFGDSSPGPRVSGREGAEGERKSLLEQFANLVSAITSHNQP